jgi:hypothetical protein
MFFIGKGGIVVKWAIPTKVGIAFFIAVPCYHDERSCLITL